MSHEADSEVIAARNLALQKIGRNVVNFQKMEAMLKFILTFANFSVPASKTESYLQQKTKHLRTKPMGELVEHTAKILHSEAAAPPPDVSELWVSLSLSLGEGGSDMKEWRREMRRIVKERNQLIHHMLVPFDPHSAESCNVLSIELDAQRERILDSYQHLESIVIAIREQHQYLADNVDAIVSGVMASRTSRGA